MKRKEDFEAELAALIPEAKVVDDGSAKSLIGQSLQHDFSRASSTEEQKEFVEERKLTKKGEYIQQTAEIREGWMEVDRRLLQERNIFYPEDWKFYIKPAEVEAIRRWSTIDDENPNSIDDVFNEILKYCLTIKTSEGTLTYGNINDWDRLFFVLLVREYTFKNGDTKVELEEECAECSNPVTINLTSISLSYDMPDNEVMKYYDAENRCWYINPEEFGVNARPIVLYLPTIDKDARLKSWVIDKIRNKKKYDEVFVKFAQWLSSKISKDENVSKQQIRELEMTYKSWNTEMFAFMDSVIKNINVIPSTYLKTECPHCGEEVTTEIRFPNGIRSLFDVQSRFKKFGKK